MENIKYKKKKIIIISGGTGGHIFPGLVIAQCFIKKGWKVSWIGSKDRLESVLIPKYNININSINIPRFTKCNIFFKIIRFIQLCASIIEARNIISYEKPNIVLGMGSYISFPGIIAAWICRVPIVIHEQNSVLGKANYVLKFFANKVIYGLPNKKLKNIFIVGNPLRFSLLNIPKPEYRLKNRTGPIRIFIAGGSQGCYILNKIMPIVASKLLFYADFIFLHQTGIGNKDVVVSCLKRLNIGKYKVFEFIDDMYSSYLWADLLISRSGALTVSEISSIGLASLFVPFIHKDKQQYWNAKILENCGAAKILEESEFTVNNVFNILIRWNRKKLFDMAVSCQKVAILNATQRIEELIENIVDNGS